MYYNKETIKAIMDDYKRIDDTFKKALSALDETEENADHMERGPIRQMERYRQQGRREMFSLFMRELLGHDKYLSYDDDCKHTIESI